MDIKESSSLTLRGNHSFEFSARPMRALMIVMISTCLSLGAVGAHSKSFGTFKPASSTKSSSSSSTKSSPAPAHAKVTSFGSFGSANKTASAATTATATAPPKTTPKSALNADVASNAAKANAMKNYDAKNASIKSADTSGYGSGSSNGSANSTGASSGSSGNYSGGYSSGHPQQTPAPVVVYNNSNSASSGPGFWSGLMVGNLLSSRHTTVEHRYENSNGPGSYGVQQPANAPMNSGVTSGYEQTTSQPEKSSFPWGTALVSLALIASFAVIGRWLVLRNRAKSATKAGRYSL